MHCTVFRTIIAPRATRYSSGRGRSVKQSAVSAADAIEVCRDAARAVLIAIKESGTFCILAYEERFALALWINIFEKVCSAGQPICVSQPASGQRIGLQGRLSHWLNTSSGKIPVLVSSV